MISTDSTDSITSGNESGRQDLLVRAGIATISALMANGSYMGLQAVRDGWFGKFVCPSSLPEFQVGDVHSAVEGTRPAGRCQTSRCGHFNRSCKLGVAVAISGRAASSRGLATVEPCGLRDTCRWFVENGASACQLCEHIVREVGIPASVNDGDGVR